MKAIMVTVDDGIHRRARIKAAELDTSVSAVLREFLIRWSGEETEFERLERLGRLQDVTLNDIDTFSAGDRLSRDDVHSRGPVRGHRRAPHP